MKEQAEFYRAALLLGIIQIKDVIAWCDSIIIEEELPDIAIIEASMSGSKGVNAVADALSGVKGGFDKRVVTKHIFGSMYDFVSQDRKQAPKVARQLYHMAIDNDVPSDEAEPEMWYFWDAIDLAVDGIHGDEEKLIDEMLQFLKVHSVPVS
jgi:hypothetical protein